MRGSARRYEVDKKNVGVSGANPGFDDEPVLSTKIDIAKNFPAMDEDDDVPPAGYGATVENAIWPPQSPSRGRPQNRLMGWVHDKFHLHNRRNKFLFFGSPLFIILVIFGLILLF